LVKMLRCPTRLGAAVQSAKVNGASADRVCSATDNASDRDGVHLDENANNGREENAGTQRLGNIARKCQKRRRSL
jgi:hypothetical protein